jgi:hypothetical protein
LFAADTNDLTQDVGCWFNIEDGNHRDCALVMENKEFLRRYKQGEIEIIKSDLLK